MGLRIRKIKFEDIFSSLGEREIDFILDKCKRTDENGNYLPLKDDLGG
jgi:hypothetical protein